ELVLPVPLPAYGNYSVTVKNCYLTRDNCFLIHRIFPIYMKNTVFLNRNITWARSASNMNIRGSLGNRFAGYISTSGNSLKSPMKKVGWYRFFLRMTMISI